MKSMIVVTRSEASPVPWVIARYRQSVSTRHKATSAFWSHRVPDPQARPALTVCGSGTGVVLIGTRDRRVS